MLDIPNTGQRHADINYRSRNRDEEGDLNPGVGEEEGCTKVEDKFDASKLLPGWEENTSECPEAERLSEDWKQSM
jgi:hypothetical protein